MMGSPSTWYFKEYDWLVATRSEAHIKLGEGLVCDDDVEPVSDDEVLFRRVPASTNWYDPQTGTLDRLSFAPNKDRDITGLSVSRAKYKSIEDAARGQLGKSYYVAVFTAQAARQAGISVVPRPQLEDGTFDRAHAELPDLNSANRKDSITIERGQVLANACIRVEGPFETLPRTK